MTLADAGCLSLQRHQPSRDFSHELRRHAAVTGSRSATRRHTEEAVALLRELDLPEPLVLPLERFEEGLAAYRSREALKVVFRP